MHVVICSRARDHGSSATVCFDGAEGSRSRTLSIVHLPAVSPCSICCRASPMDLSSWFRSTLLRKSEKTETPDPSSEQTNLLPPQNEKEEELLGVTQKLIDHVKSFALETFKNFPLPDEEGAENSPTTSSNIQKDLSEWQERHATLVLSKVKPGKELVLVTGAPEIELNHINGMYQELAHLRYKLCPGYLKEREFWRVYFMLVKNQVAEYELRAIQVARLKEMTVENEKSTNGNAREVEMAEAKQGANLAPPTP